MSKTIKYSLHFIFVIILIFSIIGLGILTKSFFNLNTEKSTNTYKVIDRTDIHTIGDKTYYGEKTLNKEITCFELSKSEIQTAQAFLLLFWIYIIPYFFYIIYLFIKE
jgi:hypothetical protein